MGVKLTLVIVFIVSLSGCKPNVAVTYNQKVMSLEKDLGPYIDQAISKFNAFHKNKNYDSVVIVSQGMEDIIEEKIKEIQRMNMADAEGGEEFKKSSIKYFAQMKDVFTAYKRMGMQTNEEARERERLQMSEITDEYDSGIKTMRKAQQKFAEANNFKIKLPE